jgi:hypothetical protein
MADPVLGMPELVPGDPNGAIRQNQINMVLARFGVQPTIAANNLTAPPGSVGKGQAWILAGAGSGQWAGRAIHTVAIALSDSPTSANGWLFYTPLAGFRVWVVAGSPTGHLVFNGTSWVAV